MNFLQAKKRAILSLITQAQGFLRTATGTSSLTLDSCIDENSLLNMTITGNISQSGTPTPTNPSPVYGVGDYDSGNNNYVIPLSCVQDGNTYNASITLAKPLYAMSSYADSLVIDFDNQTATLTEQINSTPLSNIDSIWTTGSLYNTGRCRMSGGFPSAYAGVFGAVYCDSLKGYSTLDTNAYTISSVLANSALYIYINISDIDPDLPTPSSTTPMTSAQRSSFKTFVKDFVVYYPWLNEKTIDVTSQIDWNTIPKAFAGTTTITATSNVLPTYMSADYMSRRSE